MGLSSTIIYTSELILCFHYIIYRFIPPLVILAPQFKCSCLHVDCAIVKLTCSSGKNTISILQVDLISCRYFENTLYVRSCQHISYKCENVRHFAVWLKLFVACSDGPKNFWFLLAIKQHKLQIYAKLQTSCFRHQYGIFYSKLQTSFSQTLLGLGAKKNSCFCMLAQNAI